MIHSLTARGRSREVSRIVPVVFTPAGQALRDYSTAILEILADNADPLAADVYAALDMPFAVLVGQIATAFIKK